MMKTVHMAVYDTLADWEVGAAVAHINGNHQWHREPGAFQVKTVGPTREPVTTMGAVRIVPDLALDELRPGDSEMLILAGAQTWESGALAQFTHKAREFLDAGVPVAGMCGATFGLAAAGILDDIAHTSNAPEYLAYSGYSGGAHFVRQPAVTDRNVITASGTAPFEFAREVLGRLDVYEPHILDAWYGVYGKGDAAAYAVLADYAAGQRAHA
ncbi:glutamine amidotransferase [Nocardia arthritidis]|uniref:Glutamine amidotransferase n=2 Tax=Nocardia arthritidis TaxID=228602 RepID=A0A6G9YT74_9NOCA|nr:glutamine amidotransferase [Nocardia arthritidis]